MLEKSFLRDSISEFTNCKESNNFPSISASSLKPNNIARFISRLFCFGAVKRRLGVVAIAYFSIRYLPDFLSIKADIGMLRNKPSWTKTIV